ncbi:MAG: pentapeptide repeat-containing protein [Deltaproteobacteria bacterium]|nr:pentapeptide repeat-containing protein [Deltaproteobacteria bacterium]
MACCKCNRTDIVFTDPDKREAYCLFHAPVDKKGMTAAEFQEQVLREIDRSKAADEKYCDVSGAIFPEVDFRDTTFSHIIDFDGATFTQKADFSRATFNQHVYFRGTKFTQDAVFSHATFTEDADFSLTSFSGDAEFIEAEFALAFFNGAKFDRAFFIGAIFNRDTYFSEAEYTVEASFREAVFTEDVYFSEAKFSRAFFDDAVFIQDAYFREVKFTQDIYFIRTKFEQHADFKNSFFEGTTVFEDTKFHQAEFKRLFIKEKVFFIDIDLTKEISFLQTDLRRFQFERCLWPRARRCKCCRWLGMRMFQFKCFQWLKKRDWLRGREVLWDELSIDLLDAKSTENDKAEVAPDFVTVGNLYRQLKQKYKEEHNESEASKWHYNEKEMFRKSSKCRGLFLVPLTYLYYWFSGYAERPVRAGIMLILLFMFYVGVMAGCDLEFTSLPSVQAPVKAAVLAPAPPQAQTKAAEWAWFQVPCQDSGNKQTVCLNLIAITRSPERICKDRTAWKHLVVGSFEQIFAVKDPYFKPATWPGRAWNLALTRLLIPLQVIFFGLAVRNRFRR